MNDDVLKLDKQICFRLYKASRTMVRLYQPLLDSLKITYPQYVTMLAMWEYEVIDFKELGKKLDLTTGTLTPIIIKLESLGYLIREKNDEDKRKIWVKITEEGKSLKHHALRIPETLLGYMDMDKDKYEFYVNILDEIGDVLNKAEQKQKNEVK